MSFGRITAVLVGLGWLAGLVVYAQAPVPNAPVVVVDREYEIKAKYLYFLTAFVQPKAEAASPPAVKRIAVIGPRNPKFWETTAKYQKLPLGKTEVEVKWVSFADVAAFKQAAQESWDLVFLIQADAAVIDKSLLSVSELLTGRPHVLIVTEQDDQFRKSSAVNFYEDKAANRVRIQVRLQSLDERNLVGDPGFLKNDAVIVYAPQQARS